MFRQNLLFALALLLSSLLPAQDLHVYYNVYRDSVYYTQNGKPVSRPAVRKGNRVFLHVDNYNNYLYDVSLEVGKEEIPVAGASPTSLIGKVGGGINPLGFLFKGGDQMLGGFKFFPTLEGDDLSEGSGFTKSEEEKARQEKVARLRKLEAEFGRAKEALFTLDSDLKTLQEQVQQKLNAQQLQTFAVNEVNSIRYNPRIEPSQIKRMTGEYMERIFQEKDPNKIDLGQILKIADAQTELPKSIQEYRRKADRYASSAATCSMLLGEFKKFDFPESNLDEFRNTAEAFVTAVKGKTQSHQDNATMLEEKVPELSALDTKTLSTLRTTYMELYSNNFSKTYQHTASGEKLKFELKLSPTDSMAQHGLRNIELTPVAVEVFGGMRVRASVGLSFGQFFDRPKSYFIRDSVLQSSNKDAFVPIMTSFVHFYAPSRKSISVAGSFGVGFPLGGGEDITSISFFLGPSLLFGRSERIILNAGLMGSKVERLTQGYKVGDFYTSDANIAPTNSVYELGYYLGVSFNLNGGSD